MKENDQGFSRGEQDSEGYVTESVNPGNNDASPDSEEKTPVQDVAAEEAPPGEDPIEVLKKEKEELYNRYLRLQADLENYRRRVRQEMAAMEDKTTEALVLKLLPFWDDFLRAINNTGEDLVSFRTGMEMIARKFQQILEEIGVREIGALGETFDPNRHDAFLKVSDPEAAPGTIVEELLKGYTLKDKVIRPSLVKVAGE